MPTDPPKGDVKVGDLRPNSELIAASIEAGRSLLMHEDLFVVNQGQFDRQSRVGLAVLVSRDLYRGFVSAQVLEWTGSEIEALKSIAEDLGARFQEVGVRLPDTVYLVKTTGREEALSAYTRQMNVIALPENDVAKLQTAGGGGNSAVGVAALEDLITHECFHIFSKNNPEARERLYSLIHYQLTGQPVELPDIPWPDASSSQSMRDMKITNPDAPILDTYIEMRVREDPDSADSPAIKRPLLPILMARGPYHGGLFFDYLQAYFMAIERDHAGRWKPITNARGRPLLYPADASDPGLWTQYLGLIGKNFSDELFHPDEVLAQNFVFATRLPTPQLLGEMRSVLTKEHEQMPVDIEAALRDWYENGVKKQDPAVVMKYLDPDIRWWCFGPPDYKSNGYYEKPEGVKRFFENLGATLTPDTPTSFFPREYHIAGNVATVMGLETGKVLQEGLQQTDEPFWNYFVHVFYFEGDKIVKFRANYTVIPPGSVPSPFDEDAQGKSSRPPQVVQPRSERQASHP